MTSATSFLLLVAYISSMCLLALTFEDDAVPFTSQPQDDPYYVASGEEGPLLLCSFGEEYRDRERYEHFWSRVIGSPRFITRNEQSFTPADYTLVEDIALGTYNLKINRVSFEKDNGKFFCSILDKKRGTQRETRPADIVVVVAPEAPLFERQPEQPVKENDIVTFECQSSGGNPQPEFSWRFGNGTTLSENLYQVRPALGTTGTTSSVLQWRVNAKENGAFVICEIWNKALPLGEKKLVKSNHLNVLYPPRVQAGPASPYYVEEGERAELRCDAEGNPEPSRYQWTHVPTGESHSGAIWSFIAEKRLHGDFRCMAENSLDKSTSTLTLDVLYSPVVSVKQNVTPAEGDNVNVECTFDANPAPDSVTWSGPNGFTHIGNSLQISSIKRSQSGNYTCAVINSLPLFSSNVPISRTGRTSTFVNVRHVPGNAVISSPTQHVKLNDRIVLNCNCDDEGSPKASYKWIVPFDVDSGSGSNHGLHLPQLVIDNATLQHNGIYKCMPYNDLGYGVDANFRVLVVEPPKVIRSNRSSSTFKSGDIVSLVCEAIGYPAPKITWRKDGIDLSGDLQYRWEPISSVQPPPCEFCSTTVTSSLTFSAIWSDKGNYSCVALDSASGMTDVRSTEVTISHAPKILNPLYDGRSLAAAELGSTARLSCRVSARPAPVIHWSRGSGSEQDKLDNLAATSLIDGAVDEYESVLQLENVQQTDLVEYICRASNGNGAQAELGILLEGKRAPDAPQNVHILKKDTNWITIGWQPAFDGGAEQHFELEYRLINARDEFTNPTVFVLYASNTSNTISLDTTTSSPSESPFQTFLSHNLTGLLPLAHIQYRIRALTNIGRSDWTPLKQDSTNDVEVSTDLVKPLILQYNRNDQSIAVEPNNVTVSCLMVYTGKKINDESSVDWSSIGCFDTKNNKISKVGVAEYYMVRNCIRRSPFLCSLGSEIYVEDVYGSSSVLAYVGAVIAAIVTVALICALLFFLLCRKDSLGSASKEDSPPSSVDRETIQRSKVDHISMPKPDTKNTIIHGSQTDSGVFTLRSAQEYSGKAMISGDPSTETWSPQSESEHGYDFRNDHFVQQSPVGYLVAMPPMSDIDFHDHDAGGYYMPDHSFDHVRAPRATLDEHTDSDSASFSVDGSARRVIKEIIV
uniref:B-cell receptor CD22-like n=1 Tax=Steinernema glaseri TaxID=37863 RepID=A0A1I7ZLQ2_9BILA